MLKFNKLILPLWLAVENISLDVKKLIPTTKVSGLMPVHATVE